MKYVVEIAGRAIAVEIDGDGVVVDGVRTPARLDTNPSSTQATLRLGEAVHRVRARRGAEAGRYALWVDGARFDVEALDERARAIRALAATTSGPTGPAPLRAPMPGMIVRVNVAPGDAVAAGQGLVVMEAMKMENELRAAGAGTVRAVHVAPGTAVEKGALLLELA